MEVLAVILSLIVAWYIYDYIRQKYWRTEGYRTKMLSNPKTKVLFYKRLINYYVKECRDYQESYESYGMRWGSTPKYDIMKREKLRDLMKIMESAKEEYEEKIKDTVKLYNNASEEYNRSLTMESKVEEDYSEHLIESDVTYKQTRSCTGGKKRHL